MDFGEVATYLLYFRSVHPSCVLCVMPQGE